MKNKSKSLSVSISNVGGLGALGSVAGFMQAALTGYYFGVTPQIEAYFAAIVFYTTTLKMMQTGQISEISMPMYHAIKLNEGSKAANGFYLSIGFTLLLISSAVCISGFIFSQSLIPILTPGFSAESENLSLTIFQWLLPCIVLQVAVSSLNYWLAAEKIFGVTESLRVAIAFLNLMILICLGNSIGIWVLVICLYSTNLLNLIGLLFICVKCGFRFSKIRFEDRHHVFKVFRKMPSVFIYVGATQLWSLSLTAGLTLLPQGSFAVINYAQRLAGRIGGMLNRPISVVFFSHYSEAYARGSREIKKITNRALGISLFIVTLATVFVVATGYSGLCFLWLSDQFSPESVKQTYISLLYLSLIPYAALPGIIYRKINMSHSQAVKQYLMLSVVQVCCAAYAYFFMPKLGFYGAIAILIINPLSIACVNGSLVYMTAKDSFAFYNPPNLFKQIACGVIATLPIIIWQALFFAPENFDRLMYLTISIFSGLISLSIFAIAAHNFKISEFREATGWVSSSLSKIIRKHTKQKSG